MAGPRIASIAVRFAAKLVGNQENPVPGCSRSLISTGTPTRVRNTAPDDCSVRIGGFFAPMGIVAAHADAIPQASPKKIARAMGRLMKETEIMLRL